MPGPRRYVITANIDRFEEQLICGVLDRVQAATVLVLLAEARAELATFDQCTSFGASATTMLDLPNPATQI